MKKLSAIVATAVLASSAMALDVEYFLGAGAEFSKSQVKNNQGGDNNNLKDTTALVKTGVILDKTHRISLSYSKPSDKDTSGDFKISATKILANYDYFFPITEDFRLGAGAHLGSAKLEIKGQGEKFSDSGVAYGAQLSAIYDITKNVELEVGLSHTRYGAKIELGGGENEKLKHSNALYTGINFKF